MHSNGRADIIPLLHHLCLALQPYATSQDIRLDFSSDTKTCVFHYDAGEVIKAVSDTLCMMIAFLPKDNSIVLNVPVQTATETGDFQLSIFNSGIDLSRMAGTAGAGKYPMSVVRTGAEQSHFIIRFPAQPEVTTSVAGAMLYKMNARTPVFFQEVRQRLKYYFIKTDLQGVHLAPEQLHQSGFLKKLNEVILKNIGSENFDANALSKEIVLSRAQLLRKLKPLVRQSPACYIKNMRLQKAKELLENEDLSVSEVAYKTGFKTPSHFTKVFIQKYGIRPSVFRRPKPDVTNE